MRGVLQLIESEPCTDGGWTKVERKAKRSKSTNGLPDDGKPYTNEMKSRSFRFDDTGTNKMIQDRDNVMSDHGTIGKDKRIARPEK
jgi:hypothetical protein